MIETYIADILFTANFLLATTYPFDKQLNIQLSTSSYKYQEYQNNKVLDKETANHLTNLAISYKKQFSSTSYFQLSVNYLYGNSKYEGSTWDGTSLSYTTNNSYLLNTLSNFEFNIYKYHFYTLNTNLGIGYRLWARGYNENDPNDYREYYKWFYSSIGLNNIIQLNHNITSNISIKYNHAINPTLKVILGNNPTLNLGDTYGKEFGINFKFKYPSKRQGFILGYKYTYWKSNKSNETTLVLNGDNIQIYEPNSDSKLNTYYISYFVLYK